MSERRMPMIERIVHRVEEHIEEWRKRDAVRHTGAEANRDQLWAAADRLGDGRRRGRPGHARLQHR